MRNDQRTDPDGQQSCDGKSQSDLAQIPMERLLEVVVEEREIVVGDAECDAKRYESGCNDPPAVKTRSADRLIINARMTTSKPIALVTGGSRGIGRAIVEELSKTHDVIGTYNSNRRAAESVAASTGAIMLPCQLGDLDSCHRLLESVKQRFPAVHLLVNNAAMAPRERRDILDATPDSLDEIFATNLKGPYFLTQQVARWMLDQRLWAYRLRRLNLQFHGFCEPRRLLHGQGRPQYGSQAVRGPSGW